jgi:5-methylcytosine-specific restriction endonuclease McrA
VASKRRCMMCDKAYSRSKGRHFGTFFCSDRCRWESRKVPIQVIYDRDDAICHLCDKFVPREQASRDHLRPRSLGGKLDFENIKLAHTDCNSRRGSLPVREFRELMDRLHQYAAQKDKPSRASAG